MTPIEQARGTTIAKRSALRVGEAVMARRNPGADLEPAEVIWVDRWLGDDSRWRTVVEVLFEADKLRSHSQWRHWTRPIVDVRQYVCAHLRLGYTDEAWHERHYIDSDHGEHFIGCDCSCAGCAAIRTWVDA